jgi:hypothetical protein
VKAGDYDSYLERMDRARLSRAFGLGLAAAGLAAIAGGVAVLVRSPSEPRRAQATAWLLPGTVGSAGVSLWGRF